MWFPCPDCAIGRKRLAIGRGRAFRAIEAAEKLKVYGDMADMARHVLCIAVTSAMLTNIFSFFLLLKGSDFPEESTLRPWSSNPAIAAHGELLSFAGRPAAEDSRNLSQEECTWRFMVLY